ncbi:MAG: zinc ribbon domain-containing protein [Candidatus Methylomirabilia bacterium]
MFPERPWRIVKETRGGRSEASPAGLTRVVEGCSVMQCPACGAVNNPGRVYCGGCARTLGVFCPACSFVNEPRDRYCGGCARDLLVAPIAPAEPVRAAAVAPEAPAAAAALEMPRVSPSAEADQGGLMSDLQDLDDLIRRGPAATCGESCPAIDADATQSDVDGFFRRLAREGVAEIRPEGAPGPASRSGGAPS